MSTCSVPLGDDLWAPFRTLFFLGPTVVTCSFVCLDVLPRAPFLPALWSLCRFRSGSIGDFSASTRSRVRPRIHIFSLWRCPACCSHFESGHCFSAWYLAHVRCLCRLSSTAWEISSGVVNVFSGSGYMYLCQFTEVVSAVMDHGQFGSCSALSLSQAVVSPLVLSSGGCRVDSLLSHRFVPTSTVKQYVPASVVLFGVSLRQSVLLRLRVSADRALSLFPRR